MCPSYRATRDERFSTRGRSRLFWEMLQGDVVKDGWKSQEVKQALDTCLACKGCKSDCPTHTDVASYKAEFLSHFYEGKTRPRQALTMGRIGDWAPLAGRAPWLANFLTQTPVISRISKSIGGVAQGCELPRFANEGYRRLHTSRPMASAVSKGKVIFWVDTFCEHFHPEIALAAAEVLRFAGFEPVLPNTRLCCGRPLYDFGYLDQAREKLVAILDALGTDLIDPNKGIVGVVGLEPGCLSVFKDELLKFFPEDPRAQALAKKTLLLGDFLVSTGYQPPRLEVDVLVHTHCHQKALFGAKGDQTLLAKMGARAQFLDSGCCGMAGSFGFNPEHRELSLAVGEEVLLPAVREQSADTVILTNGFSCREQIRQNTGREVMHLAELLAKAHQTATANPQARQRLIPLVPMNDSAQEVVLQKS